MSTERSPQAWSAHYLRPGTLRLPQLPPLSLYVHLPWCLKKCPYCDFKSHERSAASGVPEDAYLSALRADLEQALPLVWGRKVVSVFLGGGTPSLFSPGSIERLLNEVRSLLPLEPGCEITLEANPGTFETARFKGFKEAGVTRLSVGVQSFDEGRLQALGRVHTVAQARAALDEVARHFETFNLDLMYALPGQGLDDLARELDEALSWQPPHLSLYHLTIEPNTRFALQPPPDLPDDDLASDMLDLLIERSAAAGMNRYEVSAFAKPGHRCHHNLNYWTFGDYLGIGAGAHSKLSFPERVVRQVRWREPASYMTQAQQGAAVSNQHEVSRRDLPFEYIMNASRLREGFSLAHFCQTTGLPPSALRAGLDEALNKGLLERFSAQPELPVGPQATAWGAGDEAYRPTTRGFDFLSDLQGLFLPAP